MSPRPPAATVLILCAALLFAGAGAGLPVVTPIVDAVQGAAAADAPATMRRTLPSGGTTTISATVQNPLDIPDVMEIRFSGPAVKQGNIAVVVPPNSSMLSCTPQQDTCRLRILAGSTEDVSVTLRGERPGRNPLSVSVISSTTGKAASAEMFVIVTGETVVDAFWELVGGLLGR